MIVPKFLEGMLIHPYTKETVQQFLQDVLKSENMVQRPGITAELQTISSAGASKNDSISVPL